jgi:hypothetical protein
MKPKDGFIREFTDELLGIALKPRQANEEASFGLLVRERQSKIKALLDRMYAWLEDKPSEPPKAPVNGQPQTVRAK